MNHTEILNKLESELSRQSFNILNDYFEFDRDFIKVDFDKKEILLKNNNYTLKTKTIKEINKFFIGRGFKEAIRIKNDILLKF